MKFFIVYIAATGEIKRTGICPDDMLDIQVNAGESVTEGVAVDFDSKVTTPAIKAVGTITMAGIAVEDETFIIDTQTFIWKVARTQKGEVTIGADAPEAVTNLVAAITADLPTVIATDGAGDTVVVTAVHAGVIGNSIDFSQASSNMTMDGSGHLGGTTSGVDVVLADKTLITTIATWDKTAIADDGVDAATLGAGLPNPTEIMIQILTALGAEPIVPFNATTGSFVLKSLIVGTYKVTARAAGYKDYTVEITVS